MTDEARLGEVMEEVARMWRLVLGVEQVGHGDDFFELGGNSITAIRLAPLLQERFGVEPDITTIFDHPTPAAFARAVHELMTG
jgi:acyl carrier protein